MKSPLEIPIHHLKLRSRDSFEIHHITEDELAVPLNKAHRDDNYVLFFQEAGLSTVVVDFKEITIEGGAVFCVLPGQVHYGTNIKGIRAWVIAVDSALVKSEFRHVFMDNALRNSPLRLEEAQTEVFSECLQVIKLLERESSGLVSPSILRSMLDTCIGLFVNVYEQNPLFLYESNLRPGLITKKFRNLLLEKYRFMKKPVNYAAALNISPSYLNEAVKETTGYPVSYWIHQEIILEAKRMLFYTNNTVKEIAINLGYIDVPYFIRLFGKTTGISPIRFRQQYRK